jgi:hypothetical protein
MTLTELLMSFRSMSYEALLVALRDTSMSPEQHERIEGELRSRDRALHNQWLEVCAGVLK